MKQVEGGGGHWKVGGKIMVKWCFLAGEGGGEEGEGKKRLKYINQPTSLLFKAQAK